MSDIQQQFRQFESLANQFETLAIEMRACLNLERRIELLQRMKVLIDEIDSQVYASLNQENKRLQLVNPNPNLIPEESTP